jgi:aryl-alcohol dehydrogenase-like predicted oxidoreductase
MQNTDIAAHALLHVQIFDTADSYGTGKLNGRSEELLGQFIR